MRIRRIVVATDLSRASAAAEKAAVGLAQVLRAEVVLLHCIAPVEATILTSSEVTSLLREQEQAVRAAVARRVLRLGKRNARIKNLVVTAAAASGIVETSRKLAADLIVIGTHGRTGISRLMIGSVAERVVRTAPYPVLTVPSEGRKPTRAHKGG
jgi:nucleotide-binding universal stress UspA family protein